MIVQAGISQKRKHQILTYFIASVWFINGFFCKVLGLVPRHREIVGRILGYERDGFLTLLIGFSEIAMAIWIVSGVRSKLSAFVQIFLVAVMNTLEFVIAPDLLLWGRLNAFFAFLFILLISYAEFEADRKVFLKQ